MQNMNIKKSQEAIQAYAYYEPMQQRTADAGAMDAYEAVEQVQYDRGNTIETHTQTVMENFEEYRRDMQARTKEKKEQEDLAEEQAKEEEREIARSLTTDEIQKLKQMGIDVGSASLSDLMDLVNTMRSDAHKDILANVMAKAQIEEGDVSNLVFAGSKAQIAGTDVELQVESKDILYLLKNQLPLTQETLYKAHYSGQKPDDTGNLPNLPDKLKEQMQHIIEQAGFSVEDTTMEGAKLLVANQIPLTTDSMRNYMHMRAELGTSWEALPTNGQLEEAGQRELYETAQRLREDFAQITDADVTEALAKERPLTIASLLAGKRDMSEPAEAGTLTPEQRLQQLTAHRQLEELRLSMTQSVAVRMLKSDINIDTRDLSQVVAKLRSAEEQLARELFAKHGVTATPEEIDTYTRMQRQLQVIGTAPAARLGWLLDDARITQNDNGFTVRNVAAVVSGEGETTAAQDLSEQETIRRSRNFAAMEREYDALGTAPRRDMGDSIQKAFSNIAELLQDMQLPVDAEHIRAIRILGYNSMELTTSNVQAVLHYDRAVNDLMQACYPEAVFGMIKDGINPLDMPIEELNQTLREKQYHAGVTETENFASYLRDLEKQGAIRKEERASYIGMYRVLRQLEKSGDREAGYLFANGARLTVRNLISAMRSRKAAGLDVSVDDTFGMLTERLEYGSKMDVQLAQAFSQTEEGTEAPGVSEKNPWNDIGEDALLSETETWLARYEIEESAVNLQAGIAIRQSIPDLQISGRTDFYSMVAEEMKKLRFRDTALEEAVDEETEAMAKSMAGKEIPLPFETETLLEALQQGGDLSLTYEEIQKQLVEAMYTGAQAGVLTSADASGMKVIQAGFRILGAMAKQGTYQLPLETERGVKLVNLTIQNQHAESGTIEIHLASEIYGSLKATLRLNEKRDCCGEILAPDSEANTRLLSKTGQFQTLLAGSAFEQADITLGMQNQTLHGQTQMGATGFAYADTPSVKKLCASAVFFVKAMAKLSDI